MTSRFSKKSPVDSIIIDMILDHYNMQSMSGHPEILTGENNHGKPLPEQDNDIVFEQIKQ